MIKRSAILLIVIMSGIALSLTSCKKDNPTNDNEEGIYADINSWIQANMGFYYFWNEFVPDEVNESQVPETYFGNMLEPSDNFSYIRDDAEALLDELSGSSVTAGFSPAFRRFLDTDEVFIIIEFVYPNSPAAEAGMNRGDMITKINGFTLTLDNYIDLFYEEGEVSYTLRSYDPEEGLSDEEINIELTKQEVSTDPVLYTDIIERDGSKIGYLFYTRFLAGENDQFIQRVDEVLNEFQNEGVTELIIDLRYNPGGTINAAENLANSIAPPSVTSNEEVFVRYEYNEELEEFYIENDGMDSENLVARFSDDPLNLNLDRAFFLTTSSSASASELLINGLEPYMDVVSIGENTFGKFYGSFVLTGLNATPSHEYAIVPVTLKYANANGVTDFRNGLSPDYEAVEDLLAYRPIGDTSDPLLAKALEIITGEEGPPAKLLFELPYEKLPDPVELKRGNIFTDRPMTFPKPHNKPN
ncbi:S41 family peptidase [Gracilimonas sp.]|uniref:S41 family peptidase n=1 Tax=Gracilimonas sp. TaxID=1974203 RepID=UPI002870CD39|nr:S41 family peptidase [Gracilimonas sp.]